MDPRGRLAGLVGLLDRDGKTVSGTPKSVGNRASERFWPSSPDPRFDTDGRTVSGNTTLGRDVADGLEGAGRDGEGRRFGNDCDVFDGANWTISHCHDADSRSAFRSSRP